MDATAEQGGRPRSIFLLGLSEWAERHADELAPASRRAELERTLPFSRRLRVKGADATWCRN